MAGVSVSEQGVVSASAYGVTVDSSGNVDISGLVDKTMASLDAHAPKFVSAMTEAAASFAATDLEVEGGIASAEGAIAALQTALTTAVALLPAEMGTVAGAGAAALGTAGAALGTAAAVSGPFILLSAAVFGIEAGLLAAFGASSGTGACGTARFTVQEAINQLLVEHAVPDGIYVATPYVPSQEDIHSLVMYSGQNADAPPAPADFTWEAIWGSYPTSQAGAEAFIDETILAAFKQATGCWSNMSPLEYPVALAAAVGSWNRAHQSQRTISGPGGKPLTVGPTTIFRMVNVTKSATFAGSPYTETGEPDDAEPLSVALNMAAQKWAVGADGAVTSKGFLVKPGALASVVVNEGAGIAPGTVQSVVPKLRLTVANVGATIAATAALAVAPKPAAPPAITPKPALPPPRAVATRPPPVATPVAWYDKHVPALGGATPKEAGIFGAVVTAASWALKAARG